MNIITGYRGESHITSQQDRDIHIGQFGDGVHIIDLGSKLSATIISANEVQIADGLVVAEGCMAEVARGSSESLTISNGEQGMYRTDLVVLQYTKDSGTGVEDMQLAVIEGTSASSSPATPSYTSGSISDGDTLVEFPLYQINISGITIQSVECLVDVVALAKDSDLSTVSSALSTLRTRVNSLVSLVGSETMGTTASTVTGAIAEIFSSLTNAIAKVTTLETKTQGIVGTRQYMVASGGGKTYSALHAMSSYLVLTTAYSTDTGYDGAYLVNSSSAGTLGITTIKSASYMALADVNDCILRFTNSGNVTGRITVITLFGTIPS